MTMPHLMNCPHSEDGWCLDCVKELWDEHNGPKVMEAKLEEIFSEAKKYDTCMAISVSNEGKSVELILDTAHPYYGEWIAGEGGDICLYRDRDTNKVVGCHLPLMCDRLSVYHDGPIRINTGFKKDQSE